MSRWYQCRHCGAMLTADESKPRHLAIPGQARRRRCKCGNESIGWSLAVWGLVSLAGYLAMVAWSYQLWHHIGWILLIPLGFTAQRGWLSLRGSA